MNNDVINHSSASITREFRTEINNEFSNKTLNSNELPQLQALTFENLSTKYALTRLFTHLFISIFIIMIAWSITYFSLFSLPEPLTNNANIAIVSFALLAFLLTGYLWFSDHHKFYALREQDLSYASGLIFRKIVTQPILRIQHIELKRGPIERKVGLASLQVFSAGGALHTFEIPGLPLKKAESIRQFILQHKDMLIEKPSKNNDEMDSENNEQP